MLQVMVKEASNKLDNLLEQVAHGEEIVIVRADGSAFKLLPLPRKPQPLFGSARGLVHIGPDFDEPVKGF
jgi:antitoxin (DNA-binding transcriptional repressor) of toxin-antitoxin stability system